MGPADCVVGQNISTHKHTKTSVFLLSLMLLSSVTHKHTHKIIHGHKVLDF